MTFRTVEVNRGLVRLYDDDALVGQVRRGLDNQWYPELPGRYRQDALRDLRLAYAATVEFRTAWMDGAALLFIRLFRGRGDAYGAWSGACVRASADTRAFRTALTFGSEERHGSGSTTSSATPARGAVSTSTPTT